MAVRALPIILAATVFAAAGFPEPAKAGNPMGYALLTQEQAAALPRKGGVLGLDIERAERITDDGLAFDLMRVKQARPGSPGARAGLKPGDEIIAVDGRVFASLVTFGAYVGSLSPDTMMQVDTIPAGGGPQQAQRVAVTVGAAGHSPQGMSTGTKIAIGAGAIALFGCYELGCFNHRSRPPTPR